MKTVTKQLALNILFLAVIVTFATNFSTPHSSDSLKTDPLQSQQQVVDNLSDVKSNEDLLAEREDVFAGEAWDNIYSNILVSVDTPSIETLQNLNK